MENKCTLPIKELNTLLQKYNIFFSDWILVGPQAFRLHGHQTLYRRPEHFHIVMESGKVPWILTEFERTLVEVVPTLSSEFGRDYQKFIEETGFDFDIIISPQPLTFYAPSVKQFSLESGETFQILSLATDIDLQDYVFSQFSLDKLPRILVYCASLQTEAVQFGDEVAARKILALIEKYKKRIDTNAPTIKQKKEEYEKTKILAGSGVFPGIVTGEVLVLIDTTVIPPLEPEKIVVCAMSTPRLIPLISKSRGLITDQGGTLCHAAVLAREFQIPCVVGTMIATEILTNGDMVEVDAARGIIKKI